jgi:hypothetical protein
MSGVLISDTFLPPSVSVFTARNCNLTVLPSPSLWFRGTKLLSLYGTMIHDAHERMQRTEADIAGFFTGRV